MKFKKKPVIIEAVQFDGTLTSLDVPGFNIRSISQDLLSNTCQIETLEGVMTANPGDWVIKGVAGEFYPANPISLKKLMSRLKKNLSFYFAATIGKRSMTRMANAL